MCYLFLKNKALHLRLIHTYLFKNLFGTKKDLAWALKKNCPFIFLCIAKN